MVSSHAIRTQGPSLRAESTGAAFEQLVDANLHAALDPVRIRRREASWKLAVADAAVDTPHRAQLGELDDPRFDDVQRRGVLVAPAQLRILLGKFAVGGVEASKHCIVLHECSSCTCVLQCIRGGSCVDWGLA